MSLLIFLFILSFLVLIHEFGHFLTAKRQGIKIEEFGIGYPPRALTLLKDKSGTEYTVNWLPFGGFVKLFGEETDSTDKQAFGGKSTWRRLVVVLAGAAVNFVFGVLVFAGIYTYAGVSTGRLPWPLGYVVIQGVANNSPAEKAGLQPEDKIIGVIGRGKQYKITSSDWFMYTVTKFRGETIDLVLKDKAQVSVYVRLPNEVPEGQGAVGIEISDVFIKAYPLYELPVRGAWIGVRSALDYGALLLISLGDMSSRLLSRGEVPADVSGPIGIGYQVQKQGLLDQGFFATINFAAILSINLAIVNILPLPALDGGRAAFIIFEMITKKRIKPKIEQMVNTAGFVLLLGLIILISLRDIKTVLADVNVRNWLGRLIP